MNLLFTISEGFKGLFRARLSTTVTITSVIFSHLLIALFYIGAINVDSVIGDVRSKMELEIFLEEGLLEKNITQIQNKIKRIKGVAQIDYVSKKKAAEKFEQTFGHNIYDVLESNPLPASVIVTMKEQAQTYNAVKEITVEVQKIKGVDEVVYEEELMQIIDKYLMLVYIIALAIIIVLITITFILLYNTIRLTIYARRNIIDIMRLVGAQKGLIKRPFVIEGLLQGLIGSAIAGLITFFILRVITETIYPYLHSDPLLYLGLILLGMLIGFISSHLSVKKHLTKV